MGYDHAVAASDGVLLDKGVWAMVFNYRGQAFNKADARYSQYSTQSLARDGLYTIFPLSANRRVKPLVIVALNHSSGRKSLMLSLHRGVDELAGGGQAHGPPPFKKRPVILQGSVSKRKAVLEVCDARGPVLAGRPGDALV
ncbi:hypothetical protein ACJZ2D_011894 [Fusarium nematophilum]